MDSTRRYRLSCCLLQGIVLSVVCDAWTVEVPKKISALQDSCVIIPCSFSYSSNPPQSFIAVWYQYASRGYPVVYDGRNPSGVIDKFRGRTDLVGDVSGRDCSLKINNITRNDNGEKLYPWIDPDHISYRIYTFYDKTVELAVTDYADSPEISVLGTAVNGSSVRVTCSTVHTCPASPPNFIWSYAGDSVSSHHEHQSNGRWKSTSVLTLTTSRNDDVREMTCKVAHPGGKTASSITLYAPKDVTVFLANRAIKEGTAVILKCVSDGNPEPRHYQWFQTRGRKTIDLNNDTQLLEISNVRRDSVYSCTAHNGLGNKKSEPVTLPVEYAPEIDADSHCTLRGGAVTCNCRAVAKPPASISWNIHGTSSRETLNSSSTVNGNVVTGVLTGSLASQVNISCSAANIHGDTSYHLPFVTGNDTFIYTRNASLSIIQDNIKVYGSAAAIGILVMIIIIAVIIFKKRQQKQDTNSPAHQTLGLSEYKKESLAQQDAALYVEQNTRKNTAYECRPAGQQRHQAEQTKKNEENWQDDYMLPDSREDATDEAIYENNCQFPLMEEEIQNSPDEAIYTNM
ncbi:sialic acid-binding Ig-like lectin 5 isoform X1 [Acipenser ruthenus]|uniref:sialic acid-binding Ig-like lectin 5 isoform X1 n=1 Tax=Acipenser ruthenus TaxID=7906 RepID=UPI002740E43F|nr:sialic acid-binding Ig-like lectin 5 isoform X1 [Acipenser ruthenus]